MPLQFFSKTSTPFTKEPDFSPRQHKRDLYYAIGITTLFLILGGYGAMHHEMWRDEIQAWLLARDSTSVFDLLANMKYEGHPALWHLCLMPLTHITHNPIIMQVFHLLIAATTVFLFTRYAPFHWIHKFLFSFGYFALYEYAIVARNYALGLLLITIFCVLYRERYKRIVWIGIVLILLSHTSVHALIVAISIGVALMAEYLYFYCCKEEALTENRQLVWLGFVLIGIGIVTAILQLNPPSDYGFAVGWNFEFKFQRMNNITKIMTQALLPYPKAVVGFWGSNRLNNIGLFQLIRLPLCYLIFFWCIFRFLKRPTALVAYSMATVGLLAFFYVKYGGSIRHHGFVFITFVFTSWIYYDCPEIELPFDRISEFAQKGFGAVFTVFLIVNFLGGMTAIRMDSQHIFSNAKRTVEYIKEQGMQDMLMIGHGSPPASTIVGYLEKDRMYYPQGTRFGSFVRWDRTRRNTVTKETIVMLSEMLQTQYDQDVLIIVNSALDVELIEQYQLIFLESFTGGTLGSEYYYLYLHKTD